MSSEVTTASQTSTPCDHRGGTKNEREREMCESDRKEGRSWWWWLSVENGCAEAFPLFLVKQRSSASREARARDGGDSTHPRAAQRARFGTDSLKKREGLSVDVHCDDGEY